MTYILSDRIILKEITNNDVNGLFQCYSNQEVMKYFGREPVKDTKDVLEIIEQNIKMKEEGLGIRYVAYLKKTESFIGLVTLKRYNSKYCRGEIDYIVLPEYQRLGLASEILTLFLNEVFLTWKLERVSAYVFLNNIPSCKLLDKLKFKNEGVLRHWGRVNDVFYDAHSYSLLSSDIMEKLES
ncbi:GNAT family N-acetyltransferase [Mesobacillus foraminis]|uniref:GNAT family N-acetyltransferase n=1 Tax=Mesobacillus foraminis TaxID=279826 RepID=UPI000EF55384|nr:GNAT family protein [Mesobacillus foraminis]